MYIDVTYFILGCPECGDTTKHRHSFRRHVENFHWDKFHAAVLVDVRIPSNEIRSVVQADTTLDNFDYDPDRQFEPEINFGRSRIPEAEPVKIAIGEATRLVFLLASRNSFLAL